MKIHLKPLAVFLALSLLAQDFVLATSAVSLTNQPTNQPTGLTANVRVFQEQALIAGMTNFVQPLARRAKALKDRALSHPIESEGSDTPQSQHAGFGIQMDGKAKASVAGMVHRKESILSTIRAGQFPEGFHRETIRMNGSKWDVIVHPAILDRARSQGITLDDFIQNTVKIRGPRYHEKILQGLNGKQIVIDALEKSPNLYGNCLSDGYVYVNTHAPIEMDMLGISHEWMHEAGIFNASSKEEKILAQQDLTILLDLGLQPERLKTDLESLILVDSAFFKMDKPDFLFEGDWNELANTLQPYLQKINWDSERINEFFGLLKFSFSVDLKISRRLPGMKSQIWQILLDVGRRADIADFQEMNRLFKRLGFVRNFMNTNLAVAAKAPLESAYFALVYLDKSHRMKSFLKLRLAEVEKYPIPDIFQGILPDHVFGELLDYSAGSFSEMFFRGEDPYHTSSSLLNALPPVIRRSIAEAAMARLNGDQLPAIDSSFRDFYTSVLYSFEDRVGHLKNPAAFRRIYEGLFLWKLDDMKNWDDMGVYDELFIDEETMESGQERLLLDLANYREQTADFFNYSPGPEMLEQVVEYFRNDPGLKPVRLTPAEANTLIWLVRHIPKKDGFTRDRRRQVHRYLLAMWEAGWLDSTGSTRQFMGNVVASIDVSRVPREEVPTILNFMLQFTNLSASLRQGVAYALAKRAREWQQQSSNKKAFLTAQHFSEMTALISEALVNHLLSESMTFTDDEKVLFQQSVKKHPLAWKRNDFLQLLAGYHSFQNEEGKQRTETFIRMLLGARVKGDRFVNLPRYRFDPGTKRWMGPALLKKWLSGTRRPISLTQIQSLKGARFEGVYVDMLAHVGIKPVDASHDLASRIQEWINASENHDIPEAERIALASTLSDILQALSGGATISSERIQQWRQELLPAGSTPHWYTARQNWRELFVHLDQIQQIQDFDWSQVMELTFEVTDDPVDFALSGTEPYQTCQRLSEPTGHNGDGKPVTRMTQGQFLLSRIVARKKDGTDEVLARAHLELAEGAREEEFSLLLKKRKARETPEQILLRDIFGESKEVKSYAPKKVLLVERIYQQGAFPQELFQREILTWAAKDNLMDYAVFAGFQNGNTERIFMRFLPSEGGIYRDTFSDSFWDAVPLAVVAQEPADIQAAAKKIGNASAITRVFRHLSGSSLLSLMMLPITLFGAMERTPAAFPIFADPAKPLTQAA